MWSRWGSGTCRRAPCAALFGSTSLMRKALRTVSPCRCVRGGRIGEGQSRADEVACGGAEGAERTTMVTTVLPVILSSVWLRLRTRMDEWSTEGGGRGRRHGGGAAESEPSLPVATADGWAVEDEELSFTDGGRPEKARGRLNPPISRCPPSSCDSLVPTRPSLCDRLSLPRTARLSPTSDLVYARSTCP